jgi:hypothetical protein
VYYTYGAEQLDYGDMKPGDQGDYDTLRPFDGDEDLLREERQEEKGRDKDTARDGQVVLDEVREEVLMLEGCQSNRKLRPVPPSDDAQVRSHHHHHHQTHSLCTSILTIMSCVVSCVVSCRVVRVCSCACVVSCSRC